MVRVWAWLMVGTVAAAGAAWGQSAATQGAVSRETPAGTEQALREAVGRLDVKGATECYAASSELGEKFVAAELRGVVMAQRLVVAARAHFSEKETEGLQSPAEAMAESAQNEDVESEGDRAWIMHVGLTRETGIKLVRAKGVWQIDVEKTFRLETKMGREAAESMVASAATVDAMQRIAEEVEGGKIKTLKEMRARLAGLGKGAASEPATRGG